MNSSLDKLSGIEAAIRARGVSVVRGGKTVLDSLDLDIRRGSLTGLLGPSGSGKSTLIRAIVGVQQHVTGELTVLGRRAGTASLRHEVGYVTQAPSIYADLTVRQNLRYFADVLGAPAEHVDRAVAQVDLARQADQLVGSLSGGQESRVSLATALLGDPQLLLLDEPTVGLDPVLRRDVWALFRSLADAGVTLLVSSHVMDEAERCERIVLLRDGRLLADDPLPELLARTSTDSAEAAFLSLAEGVAA